MGITLHSIIAADSEWLHEFKTNRIRKNEFIINGDIDCPFLALWKLLNFKEVKIDVILKTRFKFHIEIHWNDSRAALQLLVLLLLSYNHHF